MISNYEKFNLKYCEETKVLNLIILLIKYSFLFRIMGRKHDHYHNHEIEWNCQHMVLKNPR